MLKILEKKISRKILGKRMLKILENKISRKILGQKFWEKLFGKKTVSTTSRIHLSCMWKNL